MKISECNHIVKCDFYGCRNIAKYSFSSDGKKRELCFCEECLNGMYNEIARIKIPKGLKSPFRINKRLRSEDETE